FARCLVCSSACVDRVPPPSLPTRRSSDLMELAVDREAIKRVVMRGQSVPAGVAMPPFVNGWTPDLDAFPAPDIAKAKELLAEARSEEHTSELQSRENLVCRLLLEKKKIER